MLQQKSLKQKITQNNKSRHFLNNKNKTEKIFSLIDSNNNIAIFINWLIHDKGQSLPNNISEEEIVSNLKSKSATYIMNMFSLSNNVNISILASNIKNIKWYIIETIDELKELIHYNFWKLLDGSKPKFEKEITKIILNNGNRQAEKYLWKCLKNNTINYLQSIYNAQGIFEVKNGNKCAKLSALYRKMHNAQFIEGVVNKGYEVEVVTAKKAKEQHMKDEINLSYAKYQDNINECDDLSIKELQDFAKRKQVRNKVEAFEQKLINWKA
ncbi:hypothetical protein ACNQ13_01625 [Mycoplasma sp. VS428]|uniref:hypothetical protein n=3 Tax=Mycoplasma TaxID=2093 RepID=UPI003AAB8112